MIDANERRRTIRLRPLWREGGEASFLSIHSTCSASTSQQAATSSNALFMDRFFACAARFFASSALCRYMSARDDI
jgi:hypothetical protein